MWPHIYFNILLSFIIFILKYRQREEELRKTADAVDQQITQDPTTGHLSTATESRISTQPGLSTSTTAITSANSLPNNPFTQQLPPYPLQTLHQRPLSIPLPPALYASSASSNSYTTSTNDNSTYNGIYHTSVLKQQNIPVPSTGSNPIHSMRSQHQAQPQQDVTHRQSHQVRFNIDRKVKLKLYNDKNEKTSTHN